MEKYKFRKSLHEPELLGKHSLQLCNQLLFEDVVCFFINNHQIDEMVGNSGNLRRNTNMVCREFDFVSEELCMEIKVFMPQFNVGYGRLKQKFGQIIKQMAGYLDGSLSLDIKGKRILLLVVGRQGIGKDIKTLISRKSGNLLKRVAGMGMELWVAEVELESGAGIELLSYENMTNDMRGGLNIG